MPRQASGSFDVVTLEDGTRAFRLRFPADGKRQRVVLHERPGCECGCGGSWTERAARTELGNVARARPRRRLGAERAAAAASAAPVAPTFHEYASAWLRGKVAGVLGDKPIDANTESDYRWRLIRHLLPFFASHRVDAIDRELCLAFKAHKLQEAAELRAALAAGADLRDRRGRPARPLGPASIRKLIDTLAAILEEAVEDGLHRPQPGSRQAHAGARAEAAADVPRDGRARRAAARPPRSRSARPSSPCSADGSTARAIASPSLAATGMRPSAIAAELGLAKSTVTLPSHASSASPTPRRTPAAARSSRRSAAAASASASCATCASATPGCTTRRLALPDRRRQDRGRHPRGPDDARPRRRAAPSTCAGSRRPATRPAPTRTCSRTTAAAASTRQRVARSSTRRRRSPTERIEARGPPAAAERRRRTRCAAPTSRSRCSPTASTSSGS